MFHFVSQIYTVAKGLYIQAYTKIKSDLFILNHKLYFEHQNEVLLFINPSITFNSILKILVLTRKFFNIYNSKMLCIRNLNELLIDLYFKMLSLGK